MKTNKTQLAYLLGVSILGSWCVVHADDTTSGSMEPQYVSIAGKPSDPVPSNGWGFSVTGEALLWLVSEGGLEYAIYENNLTVPVTQLTSGTQQLIKPQYRWGFRVGLGWDTPWDNWDIDGMWTWFETTYKSSVVVNSGDTLIQTMTDSASNSSVTTVSTATASARYNINIVDLDFTRAFYVTESLALEPLFGLRTAWLYEHVNASYTGGTVPSAHSPSSDNFKNNFWGIGTLAGFTTQWMWGWGFSLYGNYQLGLLAGRMHLLGQGYNGTTPLYFNVDHYLVSKSIRDGEFGLRWDHIFDDWFHLGFQVGWEQHFVNNFWQWQTPSNISPNGDLGIWGWNFSVTMDF